jgi:hypothetical protein
MYKGSAAKKVNVLSAREPKLSRPTIQSQASATARYPVEMFDTAFADETHRALARAMLVSACAAFDIDVAEVEFAPQRDDPRSWLCYLADPAVDGLVGSLTEKSSADHFKRYDPNGILQSSGKRIAIKVHALETSEEAPFVLVGEDGEDVLISTGQQDLLFVRTKFTYRVS